MKPAPPGAMTALRKRARDSREAEAPAAADIVFAVGPALCDEGIEDDDEDEGDEVGGEEEVVLPGADDPSFAEQYALWRERRFIDVWLQAGEEGAPEGERVPASRMMLASVSPYIRKLLLGTQQIPGLTGDTIHVGVPGGADALAQLVEALYRRRLRLAMRGPRNVLHVLRVANFLNVAVVNDAAREYLRSHLAPGNALRVAALAEAHGLADARAVAVEYAGEHFGELAKLPAARRRHGLAHVDAATLRALLASDALSVDSEMDVFMALMQWLDVRDADGERGSAGAAAGAGASGDDSNAAPPHPAPCPPDLLALIRLQHIAPEQLYAVVTRHPRLQSAAVKQSIIDTFAYHALPAELTAGVCTTQSPRRYVLVDSRCVRPQMVLRVRDAEEVVRELCDSLPADNPIKFVAKMRLTIGQIGVLVAKSRRGSLKLRFDQLDLPEDKREFWYPAEALTWPGACPSP